MTAMYITAAITGAVPRFTSIEEIKYISEDELRALEPIEQSLWRNRLLDEGWEPVESGGAFFDGEVGYSATISLASLQDMSQTKLAQEIVLLLTGQGWTVKNNEGDLEWHHQHGQCYLPASTIRKIEITLPSLKLHLEESGWYSSSRGYWQTNRARSPYVPTTASSITRSAIEVAGEGASIIHLHTRTRAIGERFPISTASRFVSLGGQRNEIDVTQYEEIIGTIAAQRPGIILNVSTSVRGNRTDFESEVRRSHLKNYGSDKLIPDTCSFSPGDVIFQAGGGYENSDSFLTAQLHRCDVMGIRPEIEVFNLEILRRFLDEYQDRIAVLGPPLIMLIACVDQYRRNSDGSTVDDSIVPSEIRRKAVQLISENGNEEEAIDLISNALMPVVIRIREKSPTSFISALLPGTLQQLLPAVAVRLKLDGVRVGLEDSLVVRDDRVPGALRKSDNKDQVRWVKMELEKNSVEILSPRETRKLLALKY